MAIQICLLTYLLTNVGFLVSSVRVVNRRYESAASTLESRERHTHAYLVSDVVDVGGIDVERNDELLALAVQPFTQRVPAHEELQYTDMQTHVPSASVGPCGRLS